MSFSWIYYLVITLQFLIHFFNMYLHIDFGIRYMLNRSHYKKRKKGQNFWDWLFFTRFKDVLPRKYYWIYYSLFVSYFVIIVVYVVLDLLRLDSKYHTIILIVYALSYLIYSAINHYSWLDVKNKRIDPGRTLTRQKRNKK